MACPTCDHTMRSVGGVGYVVFWCPRCGTIKTNHADNQNNLICLPTLIPRLQKFRNETMPRQGGFILDRLVHAWIWLGIAESIGENKAAPPIEK